MWPPNDTSIFAHRAFISEQKFGLMEIGNSSFHFPMDILTFSMRVHWKIPIQILHFVGGAELNFSKPQVWNHKSSIGYTVVVRDYCEVGVCKILPFSPACSCVGRLSGDDDKRKMGPSFSGHQLVVGAGAAAAEAPSRRLILRWEFPLSIWALVYSIPVWVGALELQLCAASLKG